MNWTKKYLIILNWKKVNLELNRAKYENKASRYVTFLMIFKHHITAFATPNAY